MKYRLNSSGKLKNFVQKFGPGFVSISPLNNIKNVIGQAAKSYHITKYKKDTKILRTRKEWNI